MAINNFKKLVEQKVNEAWYNNIDDFYHGVGKCATIGALAAGGLYCADKGMQNQELCDKQYNQDVQDKMKGSESHYQKWCSDHGLDPDDSETLAKYNDFIGESKKYNKTRKLVENMVRKNLKSQLDESRLRNVINKTVKRVLRESFEDDYNSVKDKFYSSRPNGMWGMEMKNSEGDWEYGEVSFDPKSMTMSCMGATINVDPDLSVDANLEGLYDKLIEQGYTND